MTAVTEVDTKHVKHVADHVIKVPPKATPFRKIAITKENITKKN